MNWGHKLTLVFVVFASGISYLVYRSMNVDTQLVTKDYYKDELRYQQIIDGKNTANSLSSRVAIRLRDKTVSVQMPAEMKDQNVSGSIWFYCASDANKDRHIAIQLDKHAAQEINKAIFQPGVYTVKFDWSSRNKNYYSEETMTIL
jgi:hypothetical protein